jgi:hypothetical protein
LKSLVEEDLRRCLERNQDDLVKTVKAIEDRYNNERKPPLLAFQEQACAVSPIIPHFAIRLIDYLEKEQARHRISLREKGLVFTDNEFAFYKGLASHLLKIISFFRKQIYFDQGEVSPARFKGKHNILNIANNLNTQYTPPELLILNEDVIDVKIDDTNFDMFNKETIMIGLQLVVRKMKKMAPEEAVQILEPV